MEKGSALQLHVIVYGRVQGVNFRTYTRQQAKQLGLTGWVRNLSNGTVEVLACGDRPLLEQLLNWLHHGPSEARVDRVDDNWTDTPQLFKSFEIRNGTDA